MNAIPQVPEESTSQPLGGVLRGARERMGMSLRDLAQHLRVEEGVVLAIESGRREDMPGRVFARGYIRSYTRMVGLVEEQILAQFDDEWPSDTHGQIEKIRQAPARNPGAGARGWVRIVSWLILLVLLGLFASWWYGYLKLNGNGSSSMPAVSPATQSAQPTSSPLAEPASAVPALDPEPMPAAEPKREQPVVAPAAIEERIPAPATTIETPADAPAPAAEPVTPPVDTATPAPAIASPAAAPVASVVASPTDPAPEPASAPVPPDQVAVSFSRPCWVDIRDKSGRFKLFGTMGKGVSHVLGGKPPYKLILGNAKAVAITIGGRPLDLTPYTSGNVARFSFDPKQFAAAE